MNPCDCNEVLHPTRMDIPADIRRYVVELLNQTLACTVDLRSHVKQAGWNIRGPDFAPLQGPLCHDGPRTGRLRRPDGGTDRGAGRGSARGR
jgi:hypothetical protein